MNLSLKLGCCSLWPQWLATIELCFIQLNAGLVASWQSPYLAKLNARKYPNSELPLSDIDASWIASLPNLARPCGAIFSGVLVYVIGTQLSIILSGVAFALGWLCFFVIDSLPLIYVSRVVSGVGMGMLFSVSPLYIGEIAHPKIRGALIALTMQGFLVGTLCGSIMGKYLNMWVFAAVSLAISITFLISFSVMPQTPHHLIRCHKVEEAAKSILLYDRKAHVKKELDTLQAFYQANQSTTFKNILHELNTPVNCRALLMVSIIAILTQISGRYVFSSYMEIILANAHVDIVEPSSLVIIVSLISILFSFLGILPYDKYGRTIMLFSSSIGAAFAIFLIGLNYLLLDFNFRNPNLKWLSIDSMILYKIADSSGLTVVPLALASEIFAPCVKGVGSCIISSLIGISAFLATKFYQPLVNSLTEKYLFFTY